MNEEIVEKMFAKNVVMLDLSRSNLSRVLS